MSGVLGYLWEFKHRPAEFYEVGLYMAVLILLAELSFSKLEYHMLRKAPEVNLYMGYTGKTCLNDDLKRERHIKTLNLEDYPPYRR